MNLGYGHSFLHARLAYESPRHSLIIVCDGQVLIIDSKLGAIQRTNWRQHARSVTRSYGTRRTSIRIDYSDLNIYQLFGDHFA